LPAVKRKPKRRHVGNRNHPYLLQELQGFQNHHHRGGGIGGGRGDIFTCAYQLHVTTAHNKQEAVNHFGRFTVLSKRSSASYDNGRDEKGGVISDDKNTLGSSGGSCRHPTSPTSIYGPWRGLPDRPQLMVHPKQQEQQQTVLTIVAPVGLVGWDCVTLKSMVLGRRRQRAWEKQLHKNIK
jgi:hypothetical protein